MAIVRLYMSLRKQAAELFSSLELGKSGRFFDLKVQSGRAERR